MSRRSQPSHVAEASAVPAASRSWTDSLAATLRSWLESWRRQWRDYQTRRALSRLDDALLKDLGLTRGDVRVEAERPLWQPVDYRRLERCRLANSQEWRS